MQVQSVDALKLTNIVRDKRKAASQCLPCNEQIVWSNEVALTLQFRTKLRCGFRARAIQRQFDHSRDESLDLLPLLRRVLSFCQSAEQLIDGYH